jgi:hypothetical protein
MPLLPPVTRTVEPAIAVMAFSSNMETDQFHITVNRSVSTGKSTTFPGRHEREFPRRDDSAVRGGCRGQVARAG